MVLSPRLEHELARELEPSGNIQSVQVHAHVQVQVEAERAATGNPAWVGDPWLQCSHEGPHWHCLQIFLEPMCFVVQSIPMNEQERAEEHLRTIRRLMERATIYRAISAPTALVGGLLSLVAGVIYPMLRTPARGSYTPDAHRIFICLWLLVLLLTAATNTLFIVLGAKRRNEPVFTASMKAALLALSPPFLLAATITFRAEWYGGEDFPMSYIWATCYGLGLLATSYFAPRSLIFLGWAFLLSGIAGMVVSGLVINWFGNPPFPAAFFMALTFGLFHLIYAACAWPRKGAAPEL
jgi:hypothetical protein